MWTAVALALFPATPALGQAALWRANLMEPSLMVPGMVRLAPDTALIAAPAADRFLEWRSGADWRGVLSREGRGKDEMLAAGASEALWLRALTGTALGLEWTSRRDRNRHVEPYELDSRLGNEGQALGFAWVQSLLPSEEDAGSRGIFAEMAARIPDRRAQGFQWMLAGGRRGIWRAEYGFTQEEVREEARILNLDTNGSGERVEGAYRTRVQDHRLALRAPLLGGSASWLAVYGISRPRRPESEFWFCDSSRHLRGRLAYRHPASFLGKAGAWEVRGDFQEAESHSIARRIPPGSEGVKRWHFARNHGILWELGAEASRGMGEEDGVSAGPWAWSLGAAYRGLRWNSDPPEDALESRRETLSYNRLGLSFIANLYGGLFKMSELIRAEADLGTAELAGSGEGRLGPWRAGADLVLWRTGLDLAASGQTLEQRLIAIDTADAFSIRYTGWVAGITPRLRAAFRFRHLDLEAEAAQALPVFSAIERGGASGGSSRQGKDGAEYAMGRNGFAARLRLTARF